MEARYSVITFTKKKDPTKIKALVYLRITVNAKRAEISIKRAIDPSRWDPISGRMRGTKEDAREVNSLIENSILRINKIYNRLSDENEPITAEKIKSIFVGAAYRKKTILEAFRHHNDMMKSRIGIDYSVSTHTRFETTFDHIQNFMKSKYDVTDLSLPQLKFSFITDLEHYLKVEKKCNHNSTLKYIRNFRKIINLCVKNDWLDKDPFKAYQVKLKDTKRTFLNKEELSRLESKAIGIDRLDSVRDVFVFCCYTGLSYVDVEKLTSKNLVVGLDGEMWISVDRTKTGTPSSIPLLEKPSKLIDKYKTNPECLNSGRLLPVISNQKMNAYLKELATISEIDKKLTFHAARHTFATTITLSNGIPIETVSAMLGHKNFRTTQIYAKVVQQKISDDMKKLRNL